MWDLVSMIIFINHSLYVSYSSLLNMRPKYYNIYIYIYIYIYIDFFFLKIIDAVTQVAGGSFVDDGGS
jgi:hypothetical protein